MDIITLLSGTLQQVFHSFNTTNTPAMAAIIDNTRHSQDQEPVSVDQPSEWSDDRDTWTDLDGVSTNETDSEGDPFVGQDEQEEVY